VAVSLLHRALCEVLGFMIPLSADYIIRIYRFEPDKPRSLVGLVEEVGTKGKKAFNTYDGLWEILNSSKVGTPLKPFRFDEEGGG